MKKTLINRGGWRGSWTKMLVSLFLAWQGVEIQFGAARAQTNVTIIYNFGGHYDPSTQTITNVQGINPYSGVIPSGNTLYGTTTYYGNTGVTDGGSVYKINTDGTGFATLYSFSTPVDDLALSERGSTNSDGATPYGRLLLADGALYGTTTAGGLYGSGVIFKINPDGTGFTNLYNFAPRAYDSALALTNADGYGPEGALIISGNTLYGTTEYGGPNNAGTVFAVTTNGTGFATLHSFTWLGEGGLPRSALTLIGGTLYGTAASGGQVWANGSIFQVNTDGSGFQTLFNFGGGSSDTNAAGMAPIGGLLLLGNTFYGTAADGGTNGSGDGTIYSINTDGSGFTTLHNFNGTDGYQPEADLTYYNGVLYGTTSAGGDLAGTIFRINTDGTSFTNLYTFTGGDDGDRVYSSLVVADNVFYGTAYSGGSGFEGTVFGMTVPQNPPPPPQYLGIERNDNNLVLSWTNSALRLQSANLITGPFNIVPGASSPFTNTVGAGQQFFRLVQQ